jgi:hypothetical protein
MTNLIGGLIYLIYLIIGIISGSIVIIERIYSVSNRLPNQYITKKYLWFIYLTERSKKIIYDKLNFKDGILFISMFFLISSLISFLFDLFILYPGLMPNNIYLYAMIFIEIFIILIFLLPGSLVNYNRQIHNKRLRNIIDKIVNKTGISIFILLVIDIIIVGVLYLLKFNLFLFNLLIGFIFFLFSNIFLMFKSFKKEKYYLLAFILVPTMISIIMNMFPLYNNNLIYYLLLINYFSYLSYMVFFILFVFIILRHFEKFNIEILSYLEITSPLFLLNLFIIMLNFTIYFMISDINMIFSIIYYVIIFISIIIGIVYYKANTYLYDMLLDHVLDTTTYIITYENKYGIFTLEKSVEGKILGEYKGFLRIKNKEGKIISIHHKYIREIEIKELVIR